MAKGKKTGGRFKGTPNKTTAAVKEALSVAFDKIGGIPALVEWGQLNQADFYRLWIRLLPQEVTADMTIARVPTTAEDERLLATYMNGLHAEAEQD
ncbi:hypothetical protein BH10PLA2_BH10PLA2_00470 [soil metagenome]